jgi:hypothetical protein
VNPHLAAAEGWTPLSEDFPARAVGDARRSTLRFKTVSAFCAEYIPLAYVIEGIVRSGSLYTLTAKTGSGKTALAVMAALAVATGRQDSAKRSRRGGSPTWPARTRTISGCGS